jgi:hypothetical protein
MKPSVYSSCEVKNRRTKSNGNLNEKGVSGAKDASDVDHVFHDRRRFQ